MTPTKLQKFIIFVRMMQLKNFQECFGNMYGEALYRLNIKNEFDYIDVGKFFSSLGSVDLNCLFEYVQGQLSLIERRDRNQKVEL